jgi:signal transduction histidine kinase/ligand-binding sensor domain-containing protein
MTYLRNKLAATLRSRYMAASLSFALLAAICVSGNAQGRFGQWVHTAWTEQQGAPSSVRGLARSPDGYLWIASADGLFRFDGTAFERIRFSGSRGEAISSVVNVLFSARNGDIWMATPEAVGVVRGNQVHLMSADGKPYPSHVRCFVEDTHGNIWAAAGNGLFFWSLNSWQSVGDSAGLPSKGFNSVFVERDGGILASSGVNIYERKPQAATFTDIPPQNIVAVNQMQEDATGRIWLADTSGGGVRPLVRAGATDPLRDSVVHVGSFRMLLDSDGELWITTLGDGLRRIENPEKPFGILDAKSPQLSAFTAADGLTDNYMQTMLRDEDGAMWIGTRHGLDCFRKSPISAVPIKIQNWNMTLAAGTAGDLWISENSRLTHATFEDGKVESTLVYDLRAWNKPKPVSAVPLCNDMDYAVLCADTSKVVALKHPAIVPSAYVNGRVCVDHNQAVWLAKDGYGVFTRSGDDWRTVAVDGANISSPVSVAYVGQSGVVWFAFNSRVMTVQSGVLRDAPFASQLDIGSVDAIDDSGDHVWFAGTRGLALFNARHVTRLKAVDPDVLTDIIGVQETKDGSLWLANQHGVVHIDAANVRRGIADPSYRVEQQTLGAREGFLGHNRYEEQLASDGSLWLVSQEAVLHVNTSSVGTSYEAPVTSVRELEANGQSIAPSQTVQLPPHTTNIKFRFIGINLADPVHVAYRYRLTNVDKTWQDNGAERDAMYTNLSPGEYEFHVLSRNNTGDWSPDNVKIRLVILPAWYQRAVVRVGGAAALLLLGWAFFRSRVRQAELAISKAFDERLDERTRMARELHDTFLQTVQGSKMVADDALDPSSDQLRMRHALERLSLWLGQAVTEGRAALHALRVSTTERNHIAAFLDRTAKEHAEKKSISVALTVIGDARDLHPIVRDEVSRIAEEAIRNTCLHSNANQLSIELRYARDLTLSLKDNGVGIDPEIVDAGKTGHFGIQGMKERSARIRARITITSTLNSGTQVTLVVPGDVVYRREKRTFLTALRAVKLWRNYGLARESKDKGRDRVENQ